MSDDPRGGDAPLIGAESSAAPEPSRRRRVVLAVDIGGTKFATGLVTTKGGLLDRQRADVPRHANTDSLSRLLTTLIDEQLARAVELGVEVRAVGIGSAGPITRQCETISPINIPAWQGFPLRATVARHTRLPVFGDLDAKALALAEGWLGAAKGSRNFCAMTVSTGVGGGIVIDGELLDGESGNAGHVGHLIVEPGGRRCSCGARGCLEAEASGWAIESFTGRPPDQPTYEVMRHTGELVGRGAAMICTALDLGLVVVGGAVALGFGATFFNAAQEEMDRCMPPPLVMPRPRIVSVRLGDAAPLVGAGAVALRAIYRRRVDERRQQAQQAQ